ncbi:MAG: serine hydrolase [Oscillochloris sp.]|nr:serine hydrolase [Oscillochloris sp.]
MTIVSEPLTVMFLAAKALGEKVIPATASTPYRIASLTKPITAVLIIQLVEEGAIELDAPLRSQISGYDYCAELRAIRLSAVRAQLADYRSYRDTGSLDFMTGLGVDTSKDRLFPDVAFQLPNAVTSSAAPASRCAASAATSAA